MFTLPAALLGITADAFKAMDYDFHSLSFEPAPFSMYDDDDQPEQDGDFVIMVWDTNDDDTVPSIEIEGEISAVTAAAKDCPVCAAIVEMVWDEAQAMSERAYDDGSRGW